ncbi:transglycosylase domain-containing protein [Microbacterium barkeri]|uniref:transglycosylase domain-containing protein n=1 Tax=Microbacterium TaxID=33882 RepID=UPI0024AF858F|nr:MULTISPECIES: transglycosylase domain-containing protein [Microbacterium]MDI6944220.1 transglycosylase domain-containing protein [Microbacterium barkeri]WRH16831.1 PASTA domain-containing protein [Microbacterium sp. JZ37]
MPGAKRTASGVLGGVLGLVGLSAIAGVLVTATVTPAIAVAGSAASSAITMFDKLPAYLEVDTPMLPTTIYAKGLDGKDFVLTSFYDQNRVPVSYDEVTQTMYDALLSSEDPRYYDHGGIDLIGTTRALLNNFQGGDTQGGSSISQQYVKNVLIQKCEQEAPFGSQEQLDCYNDAIEAEGVEGYERKLQEMRYAISIEQEYSKDDILIGYLNIANFGGQTYGIEAAAQYYFHTTAAKLTLSQAATLAGMVQNPNRYRFDLPDGSYTDSEGVARNTAEDGYAATKQRRDYVLGRMLEDGKITQEQHDAAVEEPIEPQITPRETGCGAAGGSAYFCKYVQQTILTDPAFGETDEERWETLRRGGLNVYTTLDFNIQMPAEAAMKTYAATHIDGIEFGSTAVTVEPSTGRILAMAQNTNFSEDETVVTTQPGYSSLVYAADSKHGSSTGFAVGSTYKLFTLIDWLEKGRSINEVLNGNNRVFQWKCNGVEQYNSTKIGNFANGNGYTGTVTNFTRDSLNSGFLAMAEQLDVCEINAVGERFGVTWGDGTPLTTPSTPEHPTALYDVLGSKNIAPLDMASAYATIANNGVRCEPHAIDRITDIDGEEVPVPETGCEPVVEPNIAATAAEALKSVMNGGTGARANPGDGTQLIGKTGTHENISTMMIESSTAATTAVWVGNTIGATDLRTISSNGVLGNDVRYYLARDIQAAANAHYPGGAFPTPDPNLTRRVLVDLPDVTGKSIDEATSILRGAGFGVTVGETVPGDQPEGTIQRQDPGAGQAAGGTNVTIFPSDGKASSVPDVSGMSVQAAFAAITGAGFDNVERGSCSENSDAGSGKVTGTDPEAGTVADPNTVIRVNYEAKSCGGGGDDKKNDKDDD